MAAPPASGGEPITDRSQLVDWFAGGCKPPERWRIGTEHEKFAFRKSDLRRLPFQGPDGIQAVLKGLTRFGWQAISENGNIIALTEDGANITLEPGGQFELSGAPLENLHQTCDEVHTHLAQVKEVGNELGTGMMGLGFDPKWRREDVGWMPKGRYEIMRNYMPKKGRLGLDMMLRTCTVQVNLDFADEADMVKKFRTSLALQPLAVALFANSPFVEGKPSGYLSYRSKVWTDTDPDRCGLLDFVFEDGFGFERYADYILDVPMYFVYRDGRYVDASGQSFREFLEGRLPALPGEQPLITDWADHVTTAFPEVRLKRYMEMRGADAGPWRRICALPALWVGLLYDGGSLDAAWDLVKDWTVEERNALLREVPRQGLKTPFRGGTVREVTQQMLAIARAGLRARGRLDRSGEDESGFLAALEEIVETGTTAAEAMLDAYENRWDHSVDPVFEEFAY